MFRRIDNLASLGKIQVRIPDSFVMERFCFIRGETGPATINRMALVRWLIEKKTSRRAGRKNMPNVEFHGGLAGKARRVRERGRVSRLYTQQWIDEYLDPQEQHEKLRRPIPIRARSEFLP